MSSQLGRTPRSACAVAHRCPCGLPDVIETHPRLAEGAPFPTLYYLPCPRAISAVGRLQAAGVRREMTQRLGDDPALAPRYRPAHAAYVAPRASPGAVP